VYDREDVDDRTCTARRIAPPSHLFIDNTLPSIDAAFSMGADAVEVDTRLTKDHQFVLFHDYSLECRTDGTGRVAEHTLAELKTIDVGYGYTADQGGSFPLRGKGIGLMPTLEEALQAHPTSRFLIQFKDRDAWAGEIMASYLQTRSLAQWDRLSFFGSIGPLSRLKALKPQARTWSASATARCLARYVMLGWTGYVPGACDGGMVVVPITQTELLSGWPNRFLMRMREHRTEVMLIGRIDGLSGANFSRLDTIEELNLVPPGFNGFVWTDRIENVGPRWRERTTPSTHQITGIQSP